MHLLVRNTHEAWCASLAVQAAPLPPSSPPPSSDTRVAEEAFLSSVSLANCLERASTTMNRPSKTIANHATYVAVGGIHYKSRFNMLRHNWAAEVEECPGALYSRGLVMPISQEAFMRGWDGLSQPQRQRLLDLSHLDVYDTLMKVRLG